MTAVETRSPSHQQLLREENHGNYLISTDPAKLDISIVHGYLTRSYWAAQISESIQQRAIANSLCFGIYHKLSDKFSQVGFARVITDYATIAYIADVFVLEEHRGKGLSKLLVRMILSHPELQVSYQVLKSIKTPRVN